MKRQTMIRHQMYRRIETMHIEIALLRVDLALRAFNPSQPRVPAGRSDGGQWTSGDNTGVSADDGDARLFRISDNDEDRYKFDLRVEEGRGGHTVGRHIGKSDDELFDRVRKSQWRTWLEHGGLRRAGSFDSIESANDLVNKTISSNRDELDAFMAGSEGRIFIKRTFDYKTGREAYSTDDQVIYTRNTYSVGIELRRDPRLARGFFVRSAYPFTIGD